MVKIPVTIKYIDVMWEFFDPEDGRDMLLRIVGLHANCTTLKSRRRQSS
jgi:hypothetical protein